MVIHKSDITLGKIMSDKDDEDICEAFTQIFNTIKNLQTIENGAKYQNNSALEKCKSEIEHLLHPFSDDRERGG